MEYPDPPQQPRTTHSPNESWTGSFVALLGYVLLVAAFYAPVIVGASTLAAGDFTEHFLPFSLFLRTELLAGRLPLWNPFTYAGHPFLADVQAGVFYPISTVLLGLTSPLGSDTARLYVLQIEALLQIVLAGFFTYLLVKALTGRQVAAFLAGGVYAFSGYLTGYPALQLAILRTGIWLPLILWLLLAAFDQPQRWRWWIAAALAYAVAFLAGHPQTFLHLSYGVLAWIALLLFKERRSRPQDLSLAGLVLRIGLFYVLFAGLIAAQLLPSLEFTRLTVRASTAYDFVSGGFPLKDTWQILLPRLLSFYSPLYAGTAALGLAMVAVVQAFGEPASARRTSAVRTPADLRLFVAFFIMLTVVALLVSYGRNAFLYPIFYRWLPGWNLFQGQERAAYLVAFGLSVLAGFGGAALDAISSRRRRLVALSYAALVVAGILVFLLRSRAAASPPAIPEPVGQAAFAALLTLALFVAVLWPNGLARWRLGLVTALAFAQLFALNRGVNTDDVALAQQAALPAEAVAVQQAVLEQGAISGAVGLLTYQGPPGRVYNEYRIFEDYGIRVGVEDLWGSSPLRLSRTAALWQNLPQDRLWQLMGVQHVLSYPPTLAVPAEQLAEFPGTGGPTYLHRLAQTNPRAWVVQNVQSAGDDAGTALLGDSRFDLATTALLPPLASAGDAGTAGRDRVAGEGLLVPPGQNTVRMQQLAPGRLRVDVQSERGGLLVIAENWMPGWQASVSQAPDQAPASAPVLRADVSLLGVPIGPGHSTVELEYRPLSLRVGIAISLASLVLLGLGALTARRRMVRWGQVVGVRGARWDRWIVAGVALMAFALRVFQLGAQELRGDEAFGYFFSLNTLPEIVRSTLALREPHPVASYFVQHGWLALAGHSEFALRFVSVWFGVLAVALLYRLGRRLGLGTATAAFAAALMAASPYAIWHSQDARMYAISLTLTTTSMWLAIEVNQRRRWRFLLAYVLVTWLALHTHYFAAFIVIAQNLYFFGVALVDKEMRRGLGRWLLAQIALALLYLPWLLVAADTLISYHGAGDSPVFAEMLQRALSVFAVGESVPVEQRLAFAAASAILLSLGAARFVWAGARGRRVLALLALVLFVPVLATWASALHRPVFNERYLIAAAPPFFLWIAAAVLGVRSMASPKPHEAAAGPLARTARADRIVGWMAAVLLVLLAFGALASLVRAYADPAYSKTIGWRQLAATLDRYSNILPAEKVRLVENFPDPTLWYYYQGPVDHLVLPPVANDPAATAREVDKLASQGVQRIVLPLQPADWWDSSGIAEQALSKRYTLLTTRQVAGWPVQIYTRLPAKLEAVDETLALPGSDQGGRITLKSAFVPSRSLGPGDLLDIYLKWEGTGEALTGSEKVTLQLLDGTGRLMTQTDQPLSTSDLEAIATPYALSIPWLLAPGDYRLIAAVYDPALPGAPRLLSESGADHLELAVLHR